jgi:hypothetical protein
MFLAALLLSIVCASERAFTFEPSVAMVPVHRPWLCGAIDTLLVFFLEIRTDCSLTLTPKQGLDDKFILLKMLASKETVTEPLTG